MRNWLLGVESSLARKIYPTVTLLISILINPFLPKIPFRSPWKHHKTKSFLMFWGGSKVNIGKKRVKWTSLSLLVHPWRTSLSLSLSLCINTSLWVSPVLFVLFFCSYTFHQVMEDTGDIKVRMSRLTIGGFLLRFFRQNNQDEYFAGP